MRESLVKIGKTRATSGATSPRPPWLRVKLRTPAQYHRVQSLVEDLNLNTVCAEARCPNIYECWGEHGTATFMILGDICTRRCGFCSVMSGRPDPGVDGEEPRRVAEAVAAMGLRHAVITSVDRDDLDDGGAEHFVQVIQAIHRGCPGCAVEVLTPDFRGVPSALHKVLAASPEVFSHNMETVPRLYRESRPGSRYERSLELLTGAAQAQQSGTFKGRVKTGIMLGLGEREEEIAETMKNIAEAGVEIFTLGQYLQPTPEHLPVDRWVTPEEFARWKGFGMALGFDHVESGPLVRSSYHAHEHVAKVSQESRGLA